MKTYKQCFFLCSALVIFFAGGNSAVSAQNKTVAAQIIKINACLDENEAAFSSATEEAAEGNAAFLRRFERSLPVLDKLIDCADRGIRIRGLPLRDKRNLAARRKEYSSAREMLGFQICVFRKLSEAEQQLVTVENRIDAKNKREALIAVESVKVSAAQGKSCAQQGIASRTIPNNLKDGLQANLEQMNSMLEKIEGLRQTIETMP